MQRVHVRKIDIKDKDLLLEFVKKTSERYQYIDSIEKQYDVSIGTTTDQFIQYLDALRLTPDITNKKRFDSLQNVASCQYNLYNAIERNLCQKLLNRNANIKDYLLHLITEEIADEIYKHRNNFMS